MDTLPLISVILPVYNGEKYLKESIESILNQTFFDFEFIIINDGSIDNSMEIIKSFTDKRIKVFENKQNRGLVYSLNKSLDKAKGKYIVRQDQDDISLPNRFFAQYKFMEKNPHVGVCGTYMKSIGDNNNIFKLPIIYDQIKVNLLFGCVINHPTVMIRQSLIKEYKIKYDQAYPHAEDYDLWSKLVNKTIITNLPKVFLLYRNHEGNTCKIFSEKQLESANKVRLRQLKNLSNDLNAEEVELHNRISNYNFENDKNFLRKVRSWFEKLILLNNKCRIYNQKCLNQILVEKYFLICRRNSYQGMNALIEFFLYKNSKYFFWNKFFLQHYYLLIKFFICCLFKR